MATHFWPTAVIYHLSQPVTSCTLLDFSLPSSRKTRDKPVCGLAEAVPFLTVQWLRRAMGFGLQRECSRVLREGAGPQPCMPLGTSLTAVLSCHDMLWMKYLKIRGCRAEASFSPSSSPSLLHSFLCLCSRSPKMQLEVLTEGYLPVSLAVCWGGDVRGAACWDPHLSKAELCSCQSLWWEWGGALLFAGVRGSCRNQFLVWKQAVYFLKWRVQGSLRDQGQISTMTRGAVCQTLSINMRSSCRN